jgi:hypothetical protein
VLEAIIFVGAVLCIQIDDEHHICQNTEITHEKVVFNKAVTDWQKITSETNYNIEEEVNFEQKNIRPRH